LSMLLLTAMLSFGFSACSGGDDDDDTGSDSGQNSTTSIAGMYYDENIQTYDGVRYSAAIRFFSNGDVTYYSTISTSKSGWSNSSGVSSMKINGQTWYYNKYSVDNGTWYQSESGAINYYDSDYDRTVFTWNESSKTLKKISSGVSYTYKQATSFSVN
ncbi:MAG: hypothetical protein Q4D41_12800, partial [Prevotellaceae bacterium]|nr:hypothetical protein [Prevotellaceae bacterium]